MPKISCRNVRLFLGARDFSGQSNSATLDMPVETPEVTTFNSIAKERLAGGIYDVEANLDIFFGTGASESDATLYELTGSKMQVGFYPKGFGTSQMGYEFGGVLGKYNTKYATADAAAGSLTISGCNGAMKSKSLYYGTINAAGTSNLVSVDFGGATASNYAVFRLQSLTGTNPTFSASIQDSTDDASFTTIDTIGVTGVLPAHITAAGGASPFTGVAFAANRYRRVIVTLGGTTPCATFQVVSCSIVNALA
jgi:hypothetical protein